MSDDSDYCWLMTEIRTTGRINERKQYPSLSLWLLNKNSPHDNYGKQYPSFNYGFWTKTHLMTTMATMANNIPRLTMAFEQKTHLMTTMESIKGKHQSLGDQSDHRTPFRPFPHLLVLKPAFQKTSPMDLAAMSFMFCTCLIRYVWYIVFWKYIYVFSSHLWFKYRIPV